MDTDRLRELAHRLDATPSELAGLLVLLAGSLVVTVLIWGPMRAGSERPEAVAGSGAAVPVGEVTVHVSGRVTAPGVVTLPDGERVGAAIAAAGGTLPDADTSAINLARVLTDGEQVRVPPMPAVDGDGPAAVAGAPPAVRDAEGRLDLNLATAADLEELPGIGPVLAERIVGWRDEHGPFRELGQLREVPGIGERTFQTLAPRITVR